MMSKDDNDKAYRNSAKLLTTEKYPSEVSKVSQKKPQHPAKISSVIELILDAGSVEKQFSETMKEVIKATGLPESAVRFKSGPIKRPSRIITKFITRISKADMRKIIDSDDPAKEVMLVFGSPLCLPSAKDVIRGMITVVNADAGIKVHKAFAVLTGKKKMAVVWHKDRCQHGEGTPGGWQDELYAIALPGEDGTFGHICELQLARKEMAVARGTLGLHDVFDAVRGVTELLRQLGVKVKSTPPLSKEELQKEFSQRFDEAEKVRLETARKLNESMSKVLALEERVRALDVVHAAVLDEKDTALNEKDATIQSNVAALNEKDAALQDASRIHQANSVVIKDLKASLQQMQSTPRAKQGNAPSAAAAFDSGAAFDDGHEQGTVETDTVGQYGFGQAGLVDSNTSRFSRKASIAAQKRKQLPSAVSIEETRAWEHGARNILKKTAAGERLAEGEVFAGFDSEGEDASNDVAAPSANRGIAL